MAKLLKIYFLSYALIYFMEKTEVKEWLQKQLAEESGVPVKDISCDENFENFQLDSLSFVSISYELESKLDMEISPTVFSEFNTINKLAAWINSQK
jgi:acyl carrier protein